MVERKRIYKRTGIRQTVSGSDGERTARRLTASTADFLIVRCAEFLEKDAVDSMVAR